jgi:HPt (histidine-containing phosphotransfer) domain-containing protein
MHTTEDRSTSTFDNPDSAWPVDLLRAVWNQQRPLVAERIGIIERAASELDQGRLDEQLRADAQRAAHMLAGSIGIFGFAQASAAARELEAELDQPSRERAQAVRALLSRLGGEDGEPHAHPGYEGRR